MHELFVEQHVEADLHPFAIAPHHRAADLVADAEDLQKEIRRHRYRWRDFQLAPASEIERIRQRTELVVVR